MSAWLWAAAGLSLFGCIGHIVDGERRFLRAYRAAPVVVDRDADYTFATLRLAWHVWSGAYAMFAAIFAWIALAGLDETGRFVVAASAALFAAIAIASIPIVRAFHPAQVLFTALAACCGAALL